MKKLVLCMFFTLVVILSSTAVYAADSQIQIDNVTVVSDVNPEMKNNRMMVPLRIVSENLGVKVDWSNSVVTLTSKDLKVTLSTSSNIAVKNGVDVQLDVKPYIKNNRVFVPLRFIAETFGSTVNYSNSTVTIDTPPLVIDGVKVNALQQETRMIIGGILRKISGNVNNAAIYQTFVDHKGEKVEAPANYSWSYNADILGSYYKTAQYDFLDDKSNVVKSFDIYSLIKNYPADVLKDYPAYLIYVAQEEQWYLFTKEASLAIDRLINFAGKNGFIKEMSI